MARKRLNTGWRRGGFTLVELLSVAGIVAILASLLLASVGRVKAKALNQRAQSEMARISSAVVEYESAHSRFPASTEAVMWAAGAGSDVTYGTPIKKDDGNSVWLAGPSRYQTNNAELMAILLDLETYRNGQPTVNKAHVKNPYRTRYLDARMTTGTNSPGIGSDGVYRDPWGSPYIVTLDLNNDGAARDVFYADPVISEEPGGGNIGLVKGTDARSQPVFQANGPVMVWSLGRDRRINWGLKASKGENKDNILGWKR